MGSATMITLKPSIHTLRLHHPMGHGVFHSGHVTWLESQFTFNYVYDCGGRMKQGLRKKRTDAYWRHFRNSRLDALFLSHFHSDHVNGLRSLLLNDVGKLRNECTSLCVFMPYLAPELRLRLLSEAPRSQSPAEWKDWAEFARDPAAWFLEKGESVVVVYVVDRSYIVSDNDHLDEGLIFGREGLPFRGQLLLQATRTPPPGVKDDLSPRIGYHSSGDAIWLSEHQSFGRHTQDNWVLCPFSDKNAFAGDVSDIPRVTGLNSKGSIDVWCKKMRKHYERAILGDINRSSMCLYSGPDKHLTSNLSYSTLPPANWKFNHPELKNSGDRVGWLGTGDSELLGNKRIWKDGFDEFLKHLKNTGSGIASLTVPHHGSDRNSDARLYRAVEPTISLTPVSKANEATVLQRIQGYKGSNQVESLATTGIAECITCGREQ